MTTNRPPFKDQVDAHLIEAATQWRRHLHSRPELSYQEFQTAEFVEEQLRSFGIEELETKLGVTGIVATIKGTAGDGPMIGLRADMDALPIQEHSGVHWSSERQGVMHACGHDGHMAMLLGAAKFLSAHRHFKGVVKLIFQPAEEGHAGAQKMIDEGLFERHPVEAIFGAHNWPQLEEGKIAATPGAIMAASDSFTIEIKGIGGHAAIPNLARDPILAGCELVSSVQRIASRLTRPVDPVVVSVTQFNGGDVFNVIPEVVKIGGTARSLSPEGRDLIEEHLELICAGIEKSHGVTISFNYKRTYPPTINTEKEAQVVQAVADLVVGEDMSIKSIEPSLGGEDFAFFLQQKPGCYFWIGAGNPERGSCLIHSPQFDFNDNCIGTGIKMWLGIVDHYLK